MLRLSPPRPRGFPAMLVALACSIPAATPQAQSTGGNYEITRSSVHAGGRTSSGDVYTLTGSVGQTEAAPVSAQGSEYSLTGGWLARGSRLPPDGALFANGFE